MDLSKDTSTHSFSNVYHKAVQSINNKKNKQNEALDMLHNNKASLRESLLNKNTNYVNSESGQYVNLGIKLLKLKVAQNENPFVKFSVNENGETREIGRAYNDEYHYITFMRDHVFVLE
jgi:hypothetical protein